MSTHPQTIDTDALRKRADELAIPASFVDALDELDRLRAAEAASKARDAERNTMGEIAVSVVDRRIAGLEKNLSFWKERAEERLAWYQDMMKERDAARAEIARLTDAGAGKPSPFDGHCCTPRDGEPFFVLLGRDPQAGPLVAKWASDRALRKPGDDKIASARQIADRMLAYAGVAPSPPAAAEVRGVPGQRVGDEEITRDIAHNEHYRLHVGDEVMLNAAYPRDLQLARAALATALKAEDVRREAIEQCAMLCDCFVTPYGRAGSAPDAIEGQMKKMAKAIQALADRPAQ